MPDTVNVRRHGSYGIDAPYWAAAFVVLMVVNIIVAFVSESIWAFVPVVLFVAYAGSCFYTTLRGKFVVWAHLLDELGLKGDEHILDMGCGRGAVLLMAAQHLTTGRAVGVDLWRTADQTGNSADVTQRNAVAEGVADRVELHTANMTALPMHDESFDLVVSSLAIHNIPSLTGRQKAVDEAVRVLRPGGRLMLADIWSTRQYAAHLVKLGMSDVSRRGLGWRMWWSGPWAATRLVSARKPEHRN